MSVEVRVPELGESVEKVTVEEWLKDEGATVERDETLVVLDSEKTSLDLPSPESGVIESIEAGAGDEVGIGDVLCRIDPSGERSPGKAVSEDKFDRKEKRGQGEGETEDDATQTEASDRKEEPAGDSRSGRKATLTAAQEADDAEEREGATETQGTREEKGSERAEPDPGATSPGTDQKPHGRDETIGDRSGEARRGERLVPMSPVRIKIAEHLLRAQREAAILTTFNRVDMTRVLEIRRRHGDAFQQRHGVRLGLMSFFVKASIQALRRIPELNGEIRGDKILYRDYQDIGIAIGSERGLVVPVLRDVQSLSFAQIEAQIRDFADRADSKRLRVEELQGGTFTITNGGVYGSLLSTPILNAPQSGVLGLHEIQDEAVVRDGQVVSRPMMNLALSYDHRIVDGREAVTFLKLIRDGIEDPARMFLAL